MASRLSLRQRLNLLAADFRVAVALMALFAVLLTTQILVIAAQNAATQPTFTYTRREFPAIPDTVCPGDPLNILVEVDYDGQAAFTIAGGSLRREASAVPVYRGFPAVVSTNLASPAGRSTFTYTVMLPVDLAPGCYFYSHAAQQMRSPVQTYEAPFTVRDCSDDSE